MITLNDCFDKLPFDRAALFIISKVAFDRNRGYTKSLDGETFWQFARRLDRALNSLKGDIASNCYTFSPYREYIRVRSGKERKIYISTWGDKITERWLATSIGQSLSKWFSPSSYAYRTGALGVDQCQSKVSRVVKKCKYFVKRDITQFFYNINHDILLGQLRRLCDKDLLQLLEQRIKFTYGTDLGNIKQANVGVPFGSPLACVLANIHLTDLDEMMALPGIHYFRYADDFLVAGDDPDAVLQAASRLDTEIARLGLTFKASHTQNFSFEPHAGFDLVKRFKFLGLEFSNNAVKLPIEKQRKIINFFKRGLKSDKYRIRNAKDKVAESVASANRVISKRIRSVAIIDYYLKHTTDEQQLRNMDRIITELVISTALDKKFRKSDFRKVSFARLRQLGLVSLVHRHKLHMHGHIKIPFLSLYDTLLIERMESLATRNRERINKIKLSRKLKKIEQNKNDRP
jgi:retron-type reverse transcriptase